jgi:HK97 family phage major capsid protein
MSDIHSLPAKRTRPGTARVPTIIHSALGRNTRSGMRPEMRARIEVLKSRFAAIGAEIRTRKEKAAGRVQSAPPEVTPEDFLFTVGRWLQAEMGDEAASRFCRANEIHVTRAAGTSPNSAGGAIVPDEIEDMVIALREQYGALRASANIANMRSDTKTIPRRTAGLTATFIGENQTLSEQSMAWDGVGLTAKKLTVFTRVSNELEEDAAIDLAIYFLQEAAFAFAKKEDDCGFNGDGTSTYGGIKGVLPRIIDGSHAAGNVAAGTGHNTFLTIDSTDLTNLMGAAPALAMPGARWFVSQRGYATTFCRLAAVAGGIVNKWVNGVLMPTFLGFPVQMTQVMPQVTTALTGQVMVAFGDMSLAASLGDRRQLKLRFLTERFIDQDQVGVIGSERIDINIHDLGDNTTAGPVVGLVGTA